MTRKEGGHSPATVQKYLKGVDYPASKNDLLLAARNNEAPQAVLDTIESLPAETFGGPQEVMKAYGELE